MSSHVMALPIIDRGGASDLLRNHLRRRAITRVGLIEGDLYMLPYWRISGSGPEGETSFHLLAAELGDPRLYRVNLPPADLKPFDPGHLPGGTRVIGATRGEAELKARAASLGWRAGSLDELIHYPFWLARVEDSGRFEGAWIDGVEGKVIHHALKAPPPVPSVGQSALILAAPAAMMGSAALALQTRAAASVAAAAVALATAPVLGWLLGRRGREERQG